MRDGHNGYLASAGILEAREAVAADYTARGVPTSPDRVLITAGTSEGIELALNALVDQGDEVLVPSPTYPLYTAVLAKIGATPRYYRTDPDRDWLPDLEHLRSLVTARTRALVVIDPNNPTGAVYPHRVRRALIDLAERHDLTILADEVYGELGFEGPVPLLGDARSRRADHLVLEPVEGLSGAGLAHRLARRRHDAAPRRGARGHQEAGRRPAVQSRARCSTQSRRRCIGDRSHQPAFRAALAERAQGHHRAAQRHPRDALRGAARARSMPCRR